MSNINNVDAWIAEIYELYYTDVYKFLICFTGNKDDAEDLTQEVFIKVIKSYSNFNKESKLKTWILSIAKHTAIDQMRRKKFYSIFKEIFFSQLPSSKKSPDEQIQGNEDRKELYNAISLLKPNYKAVIILRGINEFSIKETAEILGCTESKVKVDYYRSLRLLKNKLHIDSEEVFNNAK
ncbi:RNA polymerase sigma-70 factor (ECF subfamily) [Metabacillus crassostreae]|uniref:RNA polymerase sigma factor n=1 Tax=Metabacillus crassostreae TaxID=929098 RepID=UPI00195CE01A|nr:sigma-70 family RNA polymerase sigma factor [Metabacillus crassostreae]MBM7602629.1 RNA polymerase sigma-70 factor (ECF subfamily) [Metabacillus crassostreae]